MLAEDLMFVQIHYVHGPYIKTYANAQCFRVAFPSQDPVRYENEVDDSTAFNYEF